MNFNPLREEDLHLLAPYLENSPYVGSDFSYYSYLIWFDTEFAIKDGFLFIRAFFGDKLRYWPPLVKDNKDLKRAMSYLPSDATFTSFTKELAEQFQDEYDIVSIRDWSEYIYNAKDFILQEGKKYSAKRNHIKKFKALYNYTIETFKEEDKDEIEAFEKAWIDAKTFETDYQKLSAIEEMNIILKEVDASLKGHTICDVLKVENKIIGFTVGEITPSKTAIVSIEKADTNYEGVYSFLSHEFALRHFQNCEYINRQEDMGIEGLRKSKLSYNPSFLLDKYVLLKKNDYEFIPKPCHADDPFFTYPNDKYNDDKKEKIKNEIKNLSIDDYELRVLNVSDYNNAMGFFKCGISKLEDKKFFLNYKDDELVSILSNGHLLGLFYQNHLVATCGVDFDEEYGKELAKICGDENGRYYEFSGIMTCIYHQNRGLSRFLVNKTIEYAKEKLSPCTLCAVVQFDNVPSLKNLESVGFKEKARKRFGEYDFRYLILQI